MSRRHYINNAAVVQLTASVGTGDITLAVTSAATFPASFPWTGVINAGLGDAEIVLVTAAVGAALTVTRGYDGTAAQSHAGGATFAHVAVQADYDEANAHNNATSGVHGVTGSVVGTGGPQTLTSKTLTAPTLTSPVVTGGATVTGAVGVTGNVTATKFVGDGITPAGGVLMFGGSAAPTGWLLCDGTAVSRTTYATLFGVVGTAFGVGDGTTTFNVPRLSDHFPFGVGAKTLGTKVDTLGHTHDLNGANAAAEITIGNTGVFGNDAAVPPGTTPTFNQKLTAGSGGVLTGSLATATPVVGKTDGIDGGDLGVPYLAVNFIIKT